MKAPYSPWRRQGLALKLFRLRDKYPRLTQKAFGERYGIPLGTLKDLEQHRNLPSAAMRVLVEAISLDPDLIARAARNVEGEPDE